MMAFYSINNAPHITDPDKLVKNFEKSTAKSHPVQSGGGLVSSKNVVVPLATEKMPSSTSNSEESIRLVTPVEAEIERARQDIKSQTSPSRVRTKKRAKQTTSKSVVNKPKRQKTRDVFD